jgi:hypothetical protein
MKPQCSVRMNNSFADDRTSASYRSDKEFQKALLSFRAHLWRMNMGGRHCMRPYVMTLSILNHSTYLYDPGDTLADLWLHGEGRLITTMIIVLMLVSQR